MKTWYSITAAAPEADTAEVTVYDFIGDYGVTAVDFLRDIERISAPNIKVLINSPGGDVFAAIAMFNGLRMSGKKITTVVMGLAASAASYLMLAGDHRVMPENTMQMVHNASSGGRGTAEEMQEVVDTLKAVDRNLRATYAKRTGLSDAKVAELLSKDTFLTAAQCLEMGLCDEVIPAVKLTAVFDIERMPENIRAQFRAATVGAPRAILDVRFADRVRAMAKIAGVESYSAAFIDDPQIASIAQAQVAILLARDIKALAVVAGLPHRAESLIRARRSVPEVRTALNAELVEIDGTTRVDTAARSKDALHASAVDWSPTTLWAEIRAMKAESTK